MTKRALILGLLATALICGVCYFCDGIVRLSPPLVPNLMPPIVYGSLVLVVVGLNPLLRRWRAGWALTGAELSVAAALALAACSVPYFGLIHALPGALMMPHHYERVEPGWRDAKVLDLVPARMLADPTRDEDTALSGYITGLGLTETIGFGNIPWRAWSRALVFWVPLLLTLSLCSLALAVVLHRQWVHHEHLPYPITSVIGSLLPDDSGGISPVFRDRSFWWVAGVVFAIQLNNYLCTWWPSLLIRVPLTFHFEPLARLVPEIITGNGSALFAPGLMFAVVGIGYFFRKEVCLTIAVTPWVMCYVMGVLAGYGIVSAGFNLFDSGKVFVHFGGYVGVFLMLLYTGRHHYLQLLRRSVGLGAGGDTGAESDGSDEIWAMRAFLALALLFVVQVWAGGLPLHMAVLFLAVALVVLTVISRTIAETGAFLVGTWLLPGAVVLGFLGDRAMGPSVYATMVLLSVVLMVGPGWAPMPFCVQGLHLAERAGVKIGKLAALLGLAVVVGVAVALPATLYWQYSHGAPGTASGYTQLTAKWPFEQALRMQYRLTAQGTADQVAAASPLRRLAWLRPNRTYLIAFAVTLAVALAVGFCQVRFPNWPVHPIAFVFLGTHQAQQLAPSLLIAGLLKLAVQKYGGVQLYERLKPAMIGLIAGEMVAMLVPIAVSLIRFAAGWPA